MGKVILVKNNKGGVGKSWITLQLAHLFSKVGNRCLILTSDSQNNVLTFSKEDITYPAEATLEHWLKQGCGETVELRENVSYIPFNSSKIGKDYIQNFKKFIELSKNHFDFIFIDSTPVLGLDDIFVEEADKIIVPTYLDEATTQSTVSMFTSFEAEKIIAIIPNRFTRTAIEKHKLESLNSAFAHSSTIVTTPIPQSSEIGKLIQRNKTIFDVKNSKVRVFQDIFVEVYKKVME